MTTDSATDLVPSKLANAIRDYLPKPPRKFRKLLPLRAGIAELRRKGASYATITEILRNINVTVAYDTVFRFCHEVLGEPKGRYRRKRKTSAHSQRQRPHKDLPTKRVENAGRTPQKADNWARPAGPRIADPNNI